MATWKIVIICYCVLCYILVVPFSISAYIKRRKNGVKYIEFSEILMDLFAPLAVIYGFVMIIFGDYFEKLKEIHKHGGYKKYKEWKRQLQKEREEEQERIINEKSWIILNSNYFFFGY